MNIKKNLETISLSSVKKPMDVVRSTISASNIWSILSEGPVTYWKTDNLDLSGSKLSDEVLGDPVLPMVSENSISFFSSENLT